MANLENLNHITPKSPTPKIKNTQPFQSLPMMFLKLGIILVALLWTPSNIRIFGIYWYLKLYAVLKV